MCLRLLILNVSTFLDPYQFPAQIRAKGCSNSSCPNEVVMPRIDMSITGHAAHLFGSSSAIALQQAQELSTARVSNYSSVRVLTHTG